MGQALLTIQNLSAWYSNEKMILSDFSFVLAEHEAVGLIGLNGAGKTTILSSAAIRCLPRTIRFRILPSGNTWPMYAPPMGKRFRMYRS